ncbi:MAG: hypothetical protein K0S65_1072, partial [Labilithrix sp.]|nr:hypothetical protein [Labilithrix sp.]
MSATEVLPSTRLHRLVLLLHQGETPEGEHLTDVAMDEATTTLDAVAACVYRLRRGKLSLVGAGAAARAEELAANVAHLAVDEGGIVARCAGSGTSVLIDRAAMSAAEVDERAILERTDAARLHALPLRASGELVGVLLYATPSSATRREDVEIVTALLGLVLAAMARRIREQSELVATMHQVVAKLLDQVAYEPPRRVCYGDVPSFDARIFLQTLLDGAAIVTSAEIGALGVGTDPERPFEPFLATGVPPDVAKAIGKHPHPIGVLGAVATEGETVRVPEISEHPKFVGMPAHHPPVHSLLAVPIRIRGRSFGNLYLGNKRGQKEFSETDEQVVELLAALAAMGLHFARFALNELERQTIQQILEAAPDGLLYVDKLTGNLLVSRSFERFYGHPFNPGAGAEQELGMLCKPDGQCLSWDELPSTRALKGDPTEDVELLIVRPDGSRLP